MRFKLTDFPPLEDNPSLQKIHILADLLPRELRYVILINDFGEGNDFSHLEGEALRLAVIKHVAKIAIHPTLTLEFPQGCESSRQTQKYSKWWHVAMCKNTRINRASRTMQLLLNGLPAGMEDTYRKTIKRFQTYLDVDKTDAKEVAQQIALIEKWPKFLENLTLIEQMVSASMVTDVPAKKEKKTKGGEAEKPKSAFELVQDQMNSEEDDDEADEETEELD